MSDKTTKYVRAYILMNVRLGKMNHVLSELKTIPGVTSIAAITGEFDIIARVETESLEELYNRTQEIHLIEGISETVTSIVQKEF
ncbi:MAG: Lrp/AsnC family transcriptional regulator [Candidatus Heimdallarchaeota archaeon]|nr:Lrp/AsnC family transcriptional regulator [Candidatus Heimdallarchaeota archaeon]